MIGKKLENLKEVYQEIKEYVIIKTLLIWHYINYRKKFSFK